MDEIPSHKHDFADGNGNRVLYWDVSNLSPIGGLAGGNVVKYSWSSTTKYVGGGQAHNNMPPYLVVYMWKRVS